MVYFGVIYVEKKYATVCKPWLKYYSSNAKNMQCPKMTAYEYMVLENADNLNNYALEYFGYKETFKDFIQDINSLAQAFYNINIRKNDVVTIISVASPELIKTFYALNHIGAILNLIDVRSDAKTIKKYLKETDSKVVIVQDNFIVELNKSVNQTDVYKVITVSPYNSIPKLKKKIATAKYKKTPEYSIINEIKKDSKYIQWNKFLNIPVIEKVKFTSYKENMDAVYVHTGGTTGVSKTVRLSNDNMNAIAFQYKLFEGEYHKGETFFNDIVPFVAYGIVAAVHNPLCQGLTNIIVPLLLPSEFTKYMIEKKPNHVLAVPTYWQDFINNKKVKNMDLSFLKHAGSGGDTLTLKNKKEINDFFKERGSIASLEEGYGMTEISSTCTLCIGNIKNPNSLGIPLAKNIVGIFKPETTEEIEYTNNAVGEICITGPGMMLGYLNNKEEEEKVIKIHPDGLKWIHSGDLGYIDDDGFIHLVGRIKRMIIRGGFKIYPSEIEKVISTVKGVKEVCVVKCTSEVYGNEPIAYITIDENNTSEKEIIKNEIIKKCKKQLPEYSQPCNIIYKEKFPLTSVGKVDYKKLEEESANY